MWSVASLGLGWVSLHMVFVLSVQAEEQRHRWDLLQPQPGSKRLVLWMGLEQGFVAVG